MPKKYIWDYILYKEFECSHCGRLPVLFYYDNGGRKNNVPAIHVPLFEAVTDLRERWGRPIKFSGYRCPKYQLQLYNQGISSTHLSVHIFGMAIDGDLKTKEEVESFIELARTYQPDLRKGWQMYLHQGKTCFHLDTGYLISPPYSKALYRGKEW